VNEVFAVVTGTGLFFIGLVLGLVLGLTHNRDEVREARESEKSLEEVNTSLHLQIRELAEHASDLREALEDCQAIKVGGGATWG
jgi:uncharacterized membrane-anchored protein YhcB (DUF1043 family)